jgi:Gpi18-like mannosyltransferase
MSLIRKRPLLLLSVMLLALSLVIRFQVLTYINGDLTLLQEWYNHLLINGAAGLADEHFSNYPPAYLYLLWLSTLLSDWVRPVPSLKLIPTLFDMLSAFTIFQMARLRYRDDTPYFIGAGFFILPTILFNSSGWGQIDSLYASFLLVCAYLLLRDKPFWAMIAFGMAFSFKLQSIFLLPFLGILFLKGRIRWQHFLSIPAVYVILAIPTALIGRSWASILSIYLGQVGQFRILSNNAPNLYIFIPNSFYDVGLWIGLCVFFIVMLIWGWVNWRSKISLSHRQIMLMALVALTLVPFVLPKMHERYYYPVDVFSYAMIIFAPEMWFVPLLYQLISSLSYSVFLLGAPKTFVMLAALINMGVTIYILQKQSSSLREAADPLIRS